MADLFVKIFDVEKWKSVRTEVGSILADTLEAAGFSASQMSSAFILK
ncbi:hypothetical protein [Rhizobium leguminosarum]|nr:hypothetical protein [Rhizobium leguminosarum]